MVYIGKSDIKSDITAIAKFVNDGDSHRDRVWRVRFVVTAAAITIIIDTFIENYGDAAIRFDRGGSNGFIIDNDVIDTFKSSIFFAQPVELGNSYAYIDRGASFIAACAPVHICRIYSKVSIFKRVW